MPNGELALELWRNAQRMRRIRVFGLVTGQTDLLDASLPHRADEAEVENVGH